MGRSMHNYRRKLKLSEKHGTRTNWSSAPAWHAAQYQKKPKAWKQKPPGFGQSEYDKGLQLLGLAPSVPRGTTASKKPRKRKASRESAKVSDLQESQPSVPPDTTASKKPRKRKASRESAKVSDLQESQPSVPPDTTASKKPRKRKASRESATISDLQESVPAASKRDGSSSKKARKSELAPAVKGARRKSSDRDKLGPKVKLALNKSKVILKRPAKVSSKERCAGGKKLSARKCYLIMPGSACDRFLKLKPTFAGRRLLGTGQLSWSWLRNEKSFGQKVSEVGILPDADGHSDALDWRLKWLDTASAQSLFHLDECLGSDCFWPPSRSRVAMAAKLRTKGALQLRCTRFCAEVLSPLMDQGLEAACAEGGEQSTALKAAARILCHRCAQEWLTSGLSRESAQTLDARAAWKQMCRRSLDHDLQGSSSWQALLRGLRCSLLGRLCPWTDLDTQKVLMQRVSVLASEGGPHQRADQPDASNSPGLTSLPLGVFTFPQVLLLLTVSRWLGGEAMVIRCLASGTPLVLFRSWEASRESSVTPETNA